VTPSVIDLISSGDEPVVLTSKMLNNTRKVATKVQMMRTDRTELLD
jgi:hypothetical protein